MTKIKITSNPYQKLITYELYDERNDTWINIADSASYSGKLKAEKLIHGFFPFIVEEVVDTIIRDFDDSKNKIQLYFDGTLDEYSYLVSVCGKEDIQKVIDLQPAGRVLNNAYQVLPEVVELFDKSIRPIVAKSITQETANKDSIEADLEKYSDASGDVIPICVIGNYSAGKSTFINALIGSEILPSGDKAVTAKIYKITQSKEPDHAIVAFTVDNHTVQIECTQDAFRISDVELNNDVISRLKNELDHLQESGYVIYVNKVLTVLNDCNDQIGPSISIEIPFHKGLWEKFPGKFVIFDTPGSNAASHVDHREILTEAMQGMSNGIPVYVAERDSLDSTDNESLYDLIKEMEGLDPRFTMIVVNKADKANLPRNGFSAQEEDEILNEAIPKNLYSSGIYFVSSIMGLGSKNDGVFIDDFGADTFDLYSKRYEDPSDRHYTQLYQYDIMPGEILTQALSSAEKESNTDKVYANSGLFSVENAIQIFSSRYAAYNKCQQSQLFLGKVIEGTDAELKQLTAKREAHKQEMEAKLEHDKQIMIQDVENGASEEVNAYVKSYSKHMDPFVEDNKQYPSTASLREAEEVFKEEQQNAMDVDSLRSDAEKQRTDIGEAFKNGMQKFGENPSLSAMRDTGKSLIKEAKEAIDSNNILTSASHAVDRKVSECLIQKENSDFCAQAEKAEKDIDAAARDYWMDCSVKFREKLAEIVKNTSLTEDKKHEITEMIVNYQKLKFDELEKRHIFDVDEFDYLLRVGDFKLFKMDKILLSKLSNAYRARIFKVVDETAENIHKAYQNKFQEWEENLVNAVRTDIVDYSPELREQQNQIDLETKHIHELQDRQSRLQVYAGDIHAMMDWKET